MPGKRAGKQPECLPSTTDIARELRALEIAVSEPFAEQIQTYIRLLFLWNATVNLTSLANPRQVLIRHFGESLFAARVAGIESGNLLDIGSGAGFPALPIAAFFPAIRASLLEPNIRKSAFLSEVSRALHLIRRVHILAARLETYPPPAARFDYITSRAVRVTPSFLAYCHELLLPTGKLVLWVGDKDLPTITRIPGWLWNPSIRIPLSDHRYVLSGLPASAAASPGTYLEPRST